MSAPGLAELRKRAVPGRCLLCPRPVLKQRVRAGSMPVLCGREQCRRLYQQLHNAARAGPHPQAGYFDVREVPLLPPTGESYSEFCRRVERGGCGGLGR